MARSGQTAIPKLISAFCRLKRELQAVRGQYRRLKSDLMADIADALICDTTPQMIHQSVQALERHSLRIHLGAAAVSVANVFISADQRQFAATETLGLRVIAL